MQLSKTKRIVSWKYEELLYKNMRNIEDTKILYKIPTLNVNNLQKECIFKKWLDKSDYIPMGLTHLTVENCKK